MTDRKSSIMFQRSVIRIVFLLHSFLLCNAAPKPLPVEIIEGYSSISKTSEKLHELSPETLLEVPFEEIERTQTSQVNENVKIAEVLSNDQQTDKDSVTESAMLFVEDDQLNPHTDRISVHDTDIPVENNSNYTYNVSVSTLPSNQLQTVSEKPLESIFNAAETSSQVSINLSSEEPVAFVSERSVQNYTESSIEVFSESPIETIANESSVTLSEELGDMLTEISTEKISKDLLESDTNNTRQLSMTDVTDVTESTTENSIEEITEMFIDSTAFIGDFFKNANASTIINDSLLIFNPLDILTTQKSVDNEDVTQIIDLETIEDATEQEQVELSTTAKYFDEIIDETTTATEPKNETDHQSTRSDILKSSKKFKRTNENENSYNSNDFTYEFRPALETTNDHSSPILKTTNRKELLAGAETENKNDSTTSSSYITSDTIIDQKINFQGPSDIDTKNIDISNIDLSNIDLSGIDLTGIELSSIDFSKIDFSKLDIPRIISDINSGNVDINKLISKVSLATEPGSGNLPNIDLSQFGLSPVEVTNFDFAQQGPPDYGDNVPVIHPGNVVPFAPPNYPPPNYHQFVHPETIYPKSSYKYSNYYNIPNEGSRQSGAREIGNLHITHPFPVYNADGSAKFPQSIIPVPFQSISPFSTQNRYPLIENVRFNKNNFNAFPSHLNNHPNVANDFNNFDVPDYETEKKFMSETATSLSDNIDVNKSTKSEISAGKINLNEVLSNLTFGELDLSNMQKFGEKNNITTVDLSELPSNYSIGGMPVSEIAKSLGISKINLSDINFENFDISKLDISKLDLSKFDFSKLDLSKMFNFESTGSDDTANSEIEYPDYAIGGSKTEPQYDIEYIEYDIGGPDDMPQYEIGGSFNFEDGNEKETIQVINTSEVSTPATVKIQSNSKPETKLTVTEAEADANLIRELGIEQLVQMAGSFSISGSSSNIDFMVCTMCKTGVVMGKKLMYDMNKTDREIKSLVIYICIEFGIFPADVCRGVINVVGEEVLQVLRRTPHSPSTFCGLMLTNQCKKEALPVWSVSRREGKELDRPAPITPPAIGKYKVLHISDLHLDMDYVEGSPAECDRPMCCRNWAAPNRNDTKSFDKMLSTILSNADDPNFEISRHNSSLKRFVPTAGRWGAFGQCDLPMRTVQTILEAGAAHQPDIVYVSGDLPPHDVWMQSRQGVLRTIRTVSQMIREAFPRTTVVMNVGNHETVPINSFPVPEVYNEGFTPAWLYESLANDWREFVPHESRGTLLKGGYYSISPTPGLRVLSINSNYCNTMNWWLLIAHEDPTSQLSWLADQLSEAEAVGDKVHIVTHIPPGNADCEQSWSRQFADIIASYASTVTAVFAGHQHLDQWQVIHDPLKPSDAVSVVYIAPSATTFRHHSPSFRVYDVDGGRGAQSTWTIVDHHTYTMNLTEANKPGHIPMFERRYSARDAFNMADLSPGQWKDLVNRMVDNSTLFQEHLRFMHNYWIEPTELSSCSSSACKKKVLCYLVTGDSSNEGPCNIISQRLNSQEDPLQTVER